MSSPDSEKAHCPRCGSDRVTLCGESVELSAEAFRGQPLEERELRTQAYQCECGLAFTVTRKRDDDDG